MTPTPNEHTVATLQHATTAIAAVQDALGAVQGQMAGTVDAHLGAMKAAVAGVKKSLVRRTNAAVKHQSNLTGGIVGGMGATVQSATSAVQQQQATIAKAAVGMPTTTAADSVPSSSGAEPPSGPVSLPAGSGAATGATTAPPPAAPGGPTIAQTWAVYGSCELVSGHLTLVAVNVVPGPPQINPGYTYVAEAGVFATQADAQTWIEQNITQWISANCLTPPAAPPAPPSPPPSPPAPGGAPTPPAPPPASTCSPSVGFAAAANYFQAIPPCPPGCILFVWSGYATDAVDNPTRQNPYVFWPANATPWNPSSLVPGTNVNSWIHWQCPGGVASPPPAPPTPPAPVQPASTPPTVTATFCGCPVREPDAFPEVSDNWYLNFKDLVDYLVQLGDTVLRRQEDGDREWIDVCVWDNLARLVVRHYDQDDGPTADVVKLMSNADPCIVARAYQKGIAAMSRIQSDRARSIIAVRAVLESLQGASVSFASGGDAHTSVGANIGVSGSATVLAAKKEPRRRVARGTGT